jgi:hypothetical protein
VIPSDSRFDSPLFATEVVSDDGPQLNPRRAVSAEQFVAVDVELGTRLSNVSISCNWATVYDVLQLLKRCQCLLGRLDAADLGQQRLGGSSAS